MNHHFSLVVMGIDEAGRGPLAGPVVAAAVVFKPGKAPLGLKDSKKLSEQKRVILYDQIIAHAQSFSIKQVDHEKIDSINILAATKLAMAFAAKEVLANINVDLILVDGNQKIDVDFLVMQEAIVKGDSKVSEIMAASILAKVYRDRLMAEYDKQFPGYGFLKHKGYGTKDHLKALQKLGPCPIHRRSFRGVLS